MYSALYTFLARQIESFLGETVVIEQQNAPRLTDAHTTLHIAITNKPGSDVNEYENLVPIDLTETVQGLRVLTVSINCYGTNAGDRISRLLLYLKSDAAVYDFKRNGYGMLGTSNIRDLEYIKNQQYQERMQFDIDISTVQSIQSTIYSIEDVEISREE